MVAYLDEIDENAEELSNQVLQQTIFSLIFNQELNMTLSQLRESPNKQDFFDQMQFDILCNFIMSNRKTCIFDTRTMNNMRNILFAFIEENPHLNMKYTLNELKISLNTFEDEEFKKKNVEFYKKIGKDYMQPMQQYDELYLNEFKNMINIFISSTNHLIITILNDDLDFMDGVENLYIPCYINYIMNHYPLIIENPIYMQKIQDLLYANSLWLDLKQENALQIQNYKVQKKVKAI